MVKLITPSFKVAEDLIINFKLLSNDNSIDENVLINSTGKSRSYIRSALLFLIDLDIFSVNNGIISVGPQLATKTIKDIIPKSLIKFAITNFVPFKDYFSYMNKGKKEKQSAQLVKVNHGISNSIDDVIKIFGRWYHYLNSEIGENKGGKERLALVMPKDDSVFYFNEKGDLIYNEELLLKKVANRKPKNQHFIDPDRLERLKSVNHKVFDLSRLVRFCEELDHAFLFENYLSVGMIMRAIIDHIPPIFDCKSFNEVANNYGSKSFKKSMEHLNVSLRNISDSYLHTHIRRKEALPNKIQINFSSDMDVLLSEIIRISDQE
ncbi:hypothetical protein [Sphingobacterium thalpophilum]|uniref:Uncharacterized protein n=1 Tax=Sphingobacterium thalpophilum TaxID=259 RepID=A0A4U9U685_9SPHI|nr:hypothetical protein [Sphingobacterium thalpophilum]VTR27913.1 Uncharacterised protein [Sphingobacterium thalpophilum]